MAVPSSLSLKATLLSLVALAVAQPAPFQCPRPEPLRSDLTCDAQSLAPLPSDPAIYRPWTHEPHCIRPAEKPLLAFCVLTNAEYHGGLSLVTLPELGMHMANRTGMAMGPGERVGLGMDEENPGSGGAAEGVAEKKYEERFVEGKGRALFLKEGQSLKAGEVVLVDYPSLLIAKDAMEVLLPEERHRMNWLGVMQLPEEERGVVRGLTSRGKYADEVDNIVSMNALSVQYGGFAHMGTFPEAAKINHDCTPNLYYRFDESTLSLSVFALRDVSPGEELTYSYLDPLSSAPYADRAALLASQWGFSCACPICADTAARAASDRRRTSIRRLKGALAGAARDNPARIAGVCAELLGLYEEEGLVGPRCMVAEMAAYAANRAGDWEAAVRFAETARRYWGIVAGEASAEVRRLEGLIRDPRAHESYQPGEGLRREGEDGSQGDVVMDAVREAMKGARRAARERAVGEEEEEELVEEAVRAALKGAMSRDEL